MITEKNEKTKKRKNEKRKNRIYFLAFGLKNIHTMSINYNDYEFAINSISEQITDIRNKIEYHENLRETILDIKRLDLNIAFLKNKLKCLQVTLMGLRSNGLQLQLLVIEKLKEYITERQEIVQEISDNGYTDDNNYNNHCMFHRDIWATLDS